jgi:PAS domain-containing protein
MAQALFLPILKLVARTEHMHTEEELLQTKERLEMILDNMTDSLFVFDSQWRFSFFNKHAREQLKIWQRPRESHRESDVGGICTSPLYRLHHGRLLMGRTCPGS